MPSFLLLLALLIPATSVFPACAPPPAATAAPVTTNRPATWPSPSSPTATAPHPGTALRGVPATPPHPGTAPPGTTPPASTALASGLPTTSPGPGPPGDTTRFTWPLTAPHPVVRPFQPPATPYGPGHRGVDLAGRPGAPVTAVGEGVVFHAGPVAGRAVVSIVHANGLRTTYEPVTATVAAGTRVTRGQVIGHLVSGHLGCVAAAACLHWGALRGDEYLDPLALVTSGRVRLLPWEEV